MLTRSFSSKPPSPPDAELIVTPGTRCTASAMFLSGSLPMSSAVTTSTTESALRLVSSERSSENRKPVTVIVSRGSSAGGVVAGGGVVACARTCGSPCAVFASGDASASFAADGFVASFALSFAACAAVASGCVWLLGVSTEPVADCCACTGVTTLISATATADAIGVFLSFMSLPLIGFALRITTLRSCELPPGSRPCFSAAINATILPLGPNMLPILE